VFIDYPTEAKGSDDDYYPPPPPREAKGSLLPKLDTGLGGAGLLGPPRPEKGSIEAG
jgi:hypothetical protein